MVAPFLFRRCPGGNFHWNTDRLCYCRSGEYSKDWSGGILDLQTGECVGHMNPPRDIVRVPDNKENP
jgi:hypothetical protein